MLCTAGAGRSGESPSRDAGLCASARTAPGGLRLSPAATTRGAACAGGTYAPVPAGRRGSGLHSQVVFSRLSCDLCQAYS